MCLSCFKFPPAGNERLCFPTFGPVSCQYFEFWQFSWLCILFCSVIEHFCMTVYNIFIFLSPCLCLSLLFLSVSQSLSLYPLLPPFLSLHPALRQGLFSCSTLLSPSDAFASGPGIWSEKVLPLCLDFVGVMFLHCLFGNNLITCFLTTELERFLSILDQSLLCNISSLNLSPKLLILLICFSHNGSITCGDSLSCILGMDCASALHTNGNVTPKVLKVFYLSCWELCWLTWVYMSWLICKLCLEFTYVLFVDIQLFQQWVEFSFSTCAGLGDSGSPPSPSSDTDWWATGSGHTCYPHTSFRHSRRRKKPHP